MVDICSNYGQRFDIKLSLLKSQNHGLWQACPSGFVPYVDKVKYLGIYIKSRTNRVDLSGALRKFFGCFNNIMAVFGYGKDDMLADRTYKNVLFTICNSHDESGNRWQ